MLSIRRVSALTLIATCTFVAAFVVRKRQQAHPPAAVPATEVTLPDSVRLAKIDLAPGRQLIAFVFGGSKCASCRSPEVKVALTALRDTLHARYDQSYRTVRVVGVAINTDVNEGLEYLQGIGLDAFDEISVGGGWQNQQVVRLVWRLQVAEAAAPQVVIVSRKMTAVLSPMAVHYGNDSLVTAFAGRKALGEWFRGVGRERTAKTTASRELPAEVVVH